MPGGKNTPQNQAANQAQEPQKPPHEVGWLEKRWRMVKKGAESFGEYLLKPKTYLFAAGIAAVTLLLGPAVSPLFATGALGALGELTFASVAIKAATFVAVGTVLHMTIDMFKESGKADKETNAAHAQQQGQQRSAEGPAQQQTRGQNDVTMDDVVQPKDIPHLAVDAAEQVAKIGG